MKTLSIALVLGAVLALGTFQGLGAGTARANVACAATGLESVSTDRSDYAPEETVPIAGAGFGADCDVTVRVTRPDGSIVTGDGTFGAWPTAYDTVTTAIDGSFTFNYVLDGITGLYTVEVLDDATSANVLAVTTFSDSVTASLIPTGNGTHTAWTNDVTAVSEGTTSPVCTPASATVISTGTGTRESFSVSLSTIPNGATINTVAITVSDRGDGAASGTYKTSARLNGADTDAAADLVASGTSGACTNTRSQTIDVPDAVKALATTLEIGLVKTVTNTNAVAVGAITAVVNYTVLSAGPQAVTSSSTCVDDSSIGTKTWTSPGNVQTSDNVRATVVVDDDETSHYIKCTGFGFSIPSGATVLGIVASVERNTDSTGGSPERDASVKLVKAGAIVGNNLGTATNYTTTDVVEAHGSESNLWGTTWTPAEINASNFGIVFAAFKTGAAGPAHTVSVDQITLTIYYVTNSATFHVAKDFSDNSSAAVTMSLACTSGTVAVNDATATEVPADTADFTVTGFNSAGSTCTATETVPAGYTASQAACATVAISPGGDFSCTITNTLNSAIFHVAKNFSDNSSASVTISLACSSGTVTVNDATATEVPADTADFTVTGFNTIGTTCTATEPITPVGYAKNESACLAVSLPVGGTISCTITNSDITPPGVVCGGDLLGNEATSPAGAAVSWGAGQCTASDIADAGVLDCTEVPASGSTFVLGTTTVTCSVTDASGNTGSDTFDVEVVDTTDPAVVCGADITAAATGPSGAVVTWPATKCLATDIVDGAISCAYSPLNGSLFPIGTTIVSCAASDSHSNGPASATFHVIVTPPPAAVPPECTGMTFDNTFTGTAGNDIIYGTPQRDLMIGLGGDDRLYGLGADDCLTGGDGSDILDGGAGSDTLVGGNGGDVLYGGPGDDNATLYGGPGNDVINGGSGSDTIYGDAGNDVIFGGSGNDTIYGGDDGDGIDGGNGDDKIDGGAGNDIIFGGNGTDNIDGGNGNDVIDGGNGSDTLCGGDGSDIVSGGNGNDTLYGGAGNDILFGGAGSDTLVGGSGADLLLTGAGGDPAPVADGSNGTGACS